MSGPPGGTQVIEGSTIRMLDSQGRARAVLFIDGEIPSLVFFDEKNRPRAGLILDSDGPSLDFVDTAGNKRLRLRLRGEMDYAGLSVFDAKQQSRAALMYTSRTGPRLDLYGDDGKARMRLTAEKDGPNIRLNDDKGKLRLQLIVPPVGPLLSMFGPDKKVRVGISATDAGPRMLMANENRNILWQAP